MGLRWLDGFDHYGADVTLMTDGAYAEVNSAVVSLANPRSGTHHLRVHLGNAAGVRRVFGADLTEAGFGYAFYVPNLPSNSLSWVLAEFRDNFNVANCGIAVSTTGQVVFYRSPGSGGASSGVILATSAPCVVAKSYQHFECRAVCSDTVGACEVRINGVTVLNVAGVDTHCNLAEPIIAQVYAGGYGFGFTGTPDPLDIDDMFMWDTLSGSENNDFVGDKKVYTVFPDADTATEDWTPSEGVDSFQMLNNNPPLDDTQYLVTEDAGARTVVGLQDLPEGIVAIAGVQVVVRSWKTDAGNAKVQTGLIVTGDEADGAEHAVSQAPTYYGDVFEHDPHTSALWTVLGFNAAQAVIERTE